MRQILVGKGISEKCESSLIGLGYEVIKLPEFNKLQKGVSSHADMLIFFHNGVIYTFEEYYRKNSQIFESVGVEVKTTDEYVSNEYPRDILFNAVLTDRKVLFAKSGYTSRAITQLAERVVDVRQGYTACSTCRVDGNNFITTDKGLYKAYTENSINCLLVGKEDISLPEYDCGFIGGSSVVLADSVCFFGNIEEHRDYGEIKRFIENTGKRVISLSDEKLTDIGGAVVV